MRIVLQVENKSSLESFQNIHSQSKSPEEKLLQVSNSYLNHGSFQKNIVQIVHLLSPPQVSPQIQTLDTYVYGVIGVPRGGSNKLIFYCNHLKEILIFIDTIFFYLLCILDQV